MTLAEAFGLGSVCLRMCQAKFFVILSIFFICGSDYVPLSVWQDVRALSARTSGRLFFPVGFLRASMRLRSVCAARDFPSGWIHLRASWRL
jgi:hypothetical protein